MFLDFKDNGSFLLTGDTLIKHPELLPDGVSMNCSVTNKITTLHKLSFKPSIDRNALIEFIGANEITIKYVGVDWCVESEGEMIKEMVDWIQPVLSRFTLNCHVVNKIIPKFSQLNISGLNIERTDQIKHLWYFYPTSLSLAGIMDLPKHFYEEVTSLRLRGKMSDSVKEFINKFERLQELILPNSCLQVCDIPKTVAKLTVFGDINLFQLSKTNVKILFLIYIYKPTKFPPDLTLWWRWGSDKFELISGKQNLELTSMVK
jgi:hypothetical protein